MRPTLLLLLLLTLACQTRTNTSASETNQADTAATVDLNKMPGRDAPRSAADRMVRALYFEHDKEENPFLEKGNTALAEQYFTKPTAALVQAKAARLGSQKRHAVNPLYNVPDSRVTKMWVMPANVADTRAVIFVTYVDTKDGKEKVMRCEANLVEKGRWRIADIVYDDGQRLTEVLK